MLFNNPDVWREGYKAGADAEWGISHTPNPYPVGNEDYREWDDGFYQAGEDS